MIKTIDSLADQAQTPEPTDSWDLFLEDIRDFVSDVQAMDRRTLEARLLAIGL